MAFLPRPHNTNTENVCIWIIDYTKYFNGNGRRDWQTMEITESGYFVVFVDGRLATSFCSNAAFDAWQALESYANVSRERSEQILGPRPP